MSADDMETVFSALTGNVYVSRREGKLELGLSDDHDPEAEPKVRVVLTPRQQQGLLEELEHALKPKS